MSPKQKLAGRNSIFLLLAVYFGLSGSAQDSLTNKLAYIAIKMDMPAVKVGQTMPDCNLGRIINYKLPQAKVSDLKGKVIILDFWHQWCTACLDAFPKLEALQKEFGDQLLILPVTFQSEKSVREFMLKRIQMGKPIMLPSIVEDTLLRKMFPHDGDPHEIWIDKNGIVRSITEGQAVSKENIRKILDGTVLKMEQKNYSFDFNPWTPFLVNGNGGPDSFFYYRSMISGYLDSISSGGFQQQCNKERTRLFIANVPILDLYTQAYANIDGNPIQGLKMDYLYKRVIYETNDSSKFTYWDKINGLDYDAYLTAKRTRLFCYELILPANTSLQSAYGTMVQDLDRFFKVRSSVEKRIAAHLVLNPNKAFDNIITTGKKKEVFISSDKLHIRIVNSPLSDLIAILNIHYSIPVILDKSSYSGNVDIELDFNKAPDISSVKEQFSRYGIVVSEENTAIDMLVLHDMNMKNEPVRSK